MFKRLSVFVLVSLFAFQLPAAEPFKDGDRWLAVGDSITHGAVHTNGWRSYPEHFNERVKFELRRWSNGFSVINIDAKFDDTALSTNDRPPALIV